MWTSQTLIKIESELHQLQVFAIHHIVLIKNYGYVLAGIATDTGFRKGYAFPWRNPHQRPGSIFLRRRSRSSYKQTLILYTLFCTCWHHLILSPGKTYMFRVSNIGLSTSFNFRIQGHKLKLVEVEGSHVLQNMYDSLDIHVGQSVTLLVTLDQSPKDYYIIASTRFTGTVLTATSVLHYTNSRAPVSGPIPAGPTNEIEWSIDQARSYR